MKKTKLILAVSFIFMALFISGCAGGENDAEQAALLMEDNQLLKTKITELEGQLSKLSEKVSDGTAYSQVIGINCHLYPSGGDKLSAKSEIAFTEGFSVTAAAITEEEGFVVDYWKVNGKRLEGQEQEITVDIDSNTVIEAVLREEIKVTAVNAYMQFLDEKSKPAGDKFTEYVFEYDNDKVSGKVISVYVCAQVPKGYEIDYWLFDNVQYKFDKAVTSFKVFDLNKSVVYEAVFKKTPVKAKTPKPKAPSPKPVPQ